MKKEKLDQDEFLDKYCVSQAFERSGISWDTLMKIYDDYNDIRHELQKECEEISNYDYLVVNYQVPIAVKEVLSILTASGCRTQYRLIDWKGV